MKNHVTSFEGDQETLVVLDVSNLDLDPGALDGQVRLRPNKHRTLAPLVFRYPQRWPPAKPVEPVKRAVSSFQKEESRSPRGMMFQPANISLPRRP